jgi:hypothetical protein
MAIFPKVYTKYNPTLIVTTIVGVQQLEFGADPNIDGASPDALGPKNHDFRVPLASPHSQNNDERVILEIEIISGSFKMNVGDDPTGNPLTLIVGDIIRVSVHNRVSNLFFLNTAIGDSFTVTAGV